MFIIAVGKKPQGGPVAAQQLPEGMILNIYICYVQGAGEGDILLPPQTTNTSVEVLGPPFIVLFRRLSFEKCCCT